MRFKSLLVRNAVFGIEDGLVSTVGLLSGIAAAGVEKKTILVTGAILILVEAFSMGVGSLLSDHEGQEFDEHKEVPIKKSFWSGVVMFVSYLLAGLIPLLPYVFTSGWVAVFTSVILTLIALLSLGIVMGRMAGIPSLKQGMQMLALGGIAIALGTIAGALLK